MGSCQRIFSAIIISVIGTGQLISQSCNPIQVVAHRGVSSLAPVIDNSGCTTSDEFIFEVVNCENEFTIYPNPTIIGDKIKINLPSDFNSNQISIHDEVGRLIISLSVFQNQITWDEKNEMHSLVSTGIYYITIVNTITNKKYVGKLILV